ncbi:MAG: hypothetical protein KAR07_11745 [Spirochaetes bacterium]|nr:hypothetical protein [Spirochaetota bacterium]
MNGSYSVNKKIIVFITLISISTRLIPSSFIYFNPDGDIKKLHLINKHLRKILAGIHIIPVTKYTSFLRVLKEKRIIGCIAPLFYNRFIYAKQIPNKKEDYKKILIINNNHKLNPNSRIAIVDYGPITKILIRQKTGINFNIVLRVSKDVDALMAVKFRKADAAIIKKSSYKKISRLLNSFVYARDIAYNFPSVPMILYNKKHRNILNKIIMNKKINKLIGAKRWIITGGIK